MSPPRRPDHQSRTTKSTLAAIFTLSISSFFLGISIISYTVIQSREDLQFEQMQRHNLFSAQQAWVRGDFLACIIEANKVFSGSSYVQAQSVRKDCQNGLTKEKLNIVRRLRAEGKQQDALKLVDPLAEGNAEAKKIMEEIASLLLEIGQRHYQERSLAYFNNAIYPISMIPLASDYYNTAQTLIKQWYEEYTNNRDHILTAQAALEQEDVFQVQQALEQVSAHPFWQDYYVEAIHQEVEFLVIYQSAEAFMERQEFENAIAEAKKLPNTPPWAERKSNLISRAEAALHQREFCKTFTFILRFLQC